MVYPVRAVSNSSRCIYRNVRRLIEEGKCDCVPCTGCQLSLQVCLLQHTPADRKTVNATVYPVRAVSYRCRCVYCNICRLIEEGKCDCVPCTGCQLSLQVCLLQHTPADRSDCVPCTGCQLSLQVCLLQHTPADRRG